MRNFSFSNLNSVAGASVLLAFAIWLPAEVIGQQNGVDPKRLAVDVVSVKKLGRLHGIVLNESRSSVSVVVRRDWLKEKYPDFWKEHAASEESSLKKDREKLKQRLESWREDYEGDDKTLIGEFIDDNVKLLNLDDPIDVTKLAFTVVNIDRDRVRRTFTQTQDRHRLAGIAWTEKLEGVETTNASVLKRKLEQQEVDIEGYQLTLGNQISSTLESDQEWEARKALMEFGLLSRVEYQGSNGIFLRRGANVNPGDAIKSMLQGGGIGGLSQLDQLGKELGLPEFQDKNRGRAPDQNAWMKPMVEAAEKENRRCFSVAKMTQGQSVTVEMQLYVKADNNRWVPLATFSNSASVDDQSTDDVDLVEQDPNVARVVEMAKQFGIADQGMLQKALKSGAATKKALEKSMTELDDYVQQYSFEVDNPPVERK